MAPNHVRVRLIQEQPDECELFNKMVKDLRLKPKLVKRVIALWLALEDHGYQDFPKFILRQDDRTVEQFFRTGQAILACTKPSSKPVDPDSELRPYYEERKSIREKFVRIMGTLCNNIFGESGALEVVKVKKRWVVKEPGLTARSVGEGSNGGGERGGDLVGGLPEPVECSSGGAGRRLRSSLNPNAPEFHGHLGRRQQPAGAGLNPNAPQYQPLASRKMFLAFGYGSPLTVPEIASYFNELFKAPVVEGVNMHSSPPGQPPLCAVVEFTDSSIVAVVLGDGALALLTTVDGKQMWASPY